MYVSTHAYIPFVVSYKLDPVWTVSSCTRQKSLWSSPSAQRILRWYEANQSSVITLTGMVTSIIELVEMLFAAALSTTQPGWCDISKEHERCCCTFVALTLIAGNLHMRGFCMLLLTCNLLQMAAMNTSSGPFTIGTTGHSAPVAGTAIVELCDCIMVISGSPTFLLDHV